MEVDDFLAHYGVLGMRWGIRKDRKGGKSGGSSKKKSENNELNSTEVGVLNKMFGDRGVDPSGMHAKYGPNSLSGKEKEPFRLTDGQKTALKVAGVIGVGVGLYYLNKELPYHMGPLADVDPASKRFFKDQAKHLSKRSLDDLTTESVNLSAGSILRRVSTAKEHSVDSAGFCAAFKPQDVDRYKAAIPVFWKIWGIDKGNGGHITKIKAATGVKAPSQRETLNLFNQFIKEKPSQAIGLRANDSASFFGFAHIWSTKGNSQGQAFLDYVQGKGYNALIDINDAGALGETPLRIISGKGFSVVGNERLTPAAIKTAQSTITRIKHALKEVSEMELNDFLAHYGVKGMKWGVRRNRKASRSQTGAAKKAGIGKRQLDARKLNNRELKRVVERMKLEQEYAGLNNKKSQKSEGKKFVNDVMKSHGAKVVGAGLAVGTGLAIGKLLEGQSGPAADAGKLIKNKLAGG